jgi:hypothetical protein
MKGLTKRRKMVLAHGGERSVSTLCPNLSWVYKMSSRRLGFGSGVEHLPDPGFHTQHLRKNSNKTG